MAEGPGASTSRHVAALRSSGVESVLVEGGAGVITSVLAAGLVDRLVVAIAPIIIGAGIEAVGPLGVTRVATASGS